MLLFPGALGKEQATGSCRSLFSIMLFIVYVVWVPSGRSASCSYYSERVFLGAEEAPFALVLLVCKAD